MKLRACGCCFRAGVRPDHRLRHAVQEGQHATTTADLADPPTDARPPRSTRSRAPGVGHAVHAADRLRQPQVHRDADRNTTANVTFTATCAGNITVTGSGSGTLTGSTINWTASGLVGQGA